MKCQDEDLNAKLHNNRASAHYHLGKVSFRFISCIVSIAFSIVSTTELEDSLLLSSILLSVLGRDFLNTDALYLRLIPSSLIKEDSARSYLLVRERLRYELKAVCS